jgi:hypothetical protein
MLIWMLVCALFDQYYITVDGLMRIQVWYGALDDWILVSRVQGGFSDNWQGSSIVLQIIEAWFT